MKKILLTLIIVPLFVACSSSDDDKFSSKEFDYNINLLYGEWRATSLEGKGTLDLTNPINELYVPPTVLNFNRDGVLVSEGLFGDGNGSYRAMGKTVLTSVGKTKGTLEVIALQKSTAKVKIDAQPNLPLQPDSKGQVTITLIKDFKASNNFEYDLKMLYGEWRATSIENLKKNPVDLTNNIIEEIIPPTYLTFEEKGVYTNIGFLGNGMGKYVAENKNIHTLVNEERITFKVTDFSANTLKVKITLDEIDFNFDKYKDSEDIEQIIVVFTKKTTK